MKKVFKWLLALVAILATVIVVLLYNPNLVKGPLERQVSKLTGYPVSLVGDLDISIGRVTELSITGLYIAAPAWSAQAELAAVDRLFVSLDTASLFKETIIIDSMRLSGLQVNLETGAEGENNWASANKNAPDENKTPAAVIPIDIRLDDITVNHLDQVIDRQWIFQIDTFSQQQQESGMLGISLDGSFNGRPVDFNGDIGPFQNLLQGQDVVFDGNGHFGNLNLHGKGLIDDLKQPRRPQFDLQIKGQNIDEITAMLGVDDLGSGVFSLQARGEEINGHYEAGIKGTIGDISLDVSAQASDLLELNELDLTLAANGPNLGAFMRTLGMENWPDKPFDLKGDVDRIGSTLNIPNLTLDIGDTELVLDALLSNFPQFDAGRIKLSVVGDDAAQFRKLLGVRGVATGPFELQGRLDVSPQEEELLRFEVRTSFGYLTVSGTLGSGPSFDGSKLHLLLDGNNAHTLMSVFNIDVLPEDAFKLDAQIETSQDGLFLQRFVLVTSGNERLELGGFLSFKPGSLDTAVDVTINGQHLRRGLQHFVPGLQVPDLPYDLSGHVRVMEESVELHDVKAGFADIELDLAGSISLSDHLVGTSLDFDLDGKDLSTLNEIPSLHGSLAIFVPGQSYHAAGRFGIASNGWGLDNIKGRIGDTDIAIDGQISNQPDWSGSNIDFSIKGPDLHAFLVDQDASDLSIGAFESSGRLILAEDKLRVRDFSFKTDKTSGEAELVFGWPISTPVDADFNVNIRGDDVRHLIPGSGMFEPAMAAYRINAIGHQRDDFISFKHLDAVIGDLHVALEGKVDENIEFTFNAQSDNLSTIGLLNGKPLPVMALNLNSDFISGTRHFGFQNILGSLGETDISGNMEILLGEPRPKIDLTVESRLIDLRPFLSQFDNEDKELEVSDRERLIPATPLPLKALKTADIALTFKAEEIRRKNDSLRNLVLEANVLDGHLNIPSVSFHGKRQGQYQSSLTINPTDADNADVKIDISAEKMLLNLIKQTPDKLSELPLYDLEFHATGSGGDLRELAASLNGSLTMESDGGSLGEVNLGMFDIFLIDQIFGLIMPKSTKDDLLEVNCYASAFTIADGLVKTDPAIAYSTNKLILIAKGTLDLKTEKLNFHFNATPTKALKISAGELFNPFIRIGGTLADPKVGLDPSKALLHGGAAVGTAGISILAKGLLDRMSTATPLCEEMLEQVRQDQ